MAGRRHGAADTLGPVLERLKRLFARGERAGDVQYDPRTNEPVRTVPAGPPTTSYPPAVPLEEPASDEPEER
jgi:hypothetical protein